MDQEMADGWLFSEYAQDHVCVTVIFLLAFLGGRAVYGEVRRRGRRMDVVVVGAGPVGLTASFIAMRHPRVGRVMVFEELSRERVIHSDYQITLDADSSEFLQSHGVDFNNMEGCREGGLFYTKVGVYLEYLLDQIQYTGQQCQVLFETKVRYDA